MNNSDRPASPISVVASSRFPDYKYETGLTKRETFAMAAMQGLLAEGNTDYCDISCRSVQCADALLKELEK